MWWDRISRWSVWQKSMQSICVGQWSAVVILTGPPEKNDLVLTTVTCVYVMSSCTLWLQQASIIWSFITPLSHPHLVTSGYKQQHWCDKKAIAEAETSGGNCSGYVYLSYTAHGYNESNFWNLLMVFIDSNFVQVAEILTLFVVNSFDFSSLQKLSSKHFKTSATSPL